MRTKRGSKLITDEKWIGRLPEVALAQAITWRRPKRNKGLVITLDFLLTFRWWIRLTCSIARTEMYRAFCDSCFGSGRWILNTTTHRWNPMRFWSITSWMAQYWFWITTADCPVATKWLRTVPTSLSTSYKTCRRVKSSAEQRSCAA